MVSTNDIFNKSINIRPGPLARAETAKLYINRNDTDTLIGLAQSVQITYGQQLQRVFELGSFDYYMVSGRTQGSLQVARFIGVSRSGNTTLRQILGDQFYQVEPNGTDGTGGVLMLQDTKTNVRYVCSGCYVANQSVGVDANGTVITENISIEFQKLTVEPG